MEEEMSDKHQSRVANINIKVDFQTRNITVNKDVYFIMIEIK